MAKGSEFVTLLGDPTSPVVLDVKSFPPYLELDELAINRALAAKLVDRTGIKAISISACDPFQTINLQYLHPSLPIVIRELLSRVQQIMPKQGNLVLPYDFRTEAESPISTLGVVLVVNNLSLREQIAANTKDKFNSRDMHSWAPYLDRHLKDVFLDVGSDNILTSMRAWGISHRSLGLATRMAQLRFDLSTGTLLTAAT